MTSTRPHLATRFATYRGALVRALATVWLVLYAVMVGGLPIADARAESAGRVVPHWESKESPCTAGHHGELCQLCQVLTSAVEPSGEAVVLRPRTSTPHQLVPAGAREGAANGCRAGPSTRAPPIA